MNQAFGSCRVGKCSMFLLSSCPCHSLNFTSNDFTFESGADELVGTLQLDVELWQVLADVHHEGQTMNLPSKLCKHICVTPAIVLLNDKPDHCTRWWLSSQMKQTNKRNKSLKPQMIAGIRKKEKKRLPLRRDLQRKQETAGRVPPPHVPTRNQSVNQLHLRRRGQTAQLHGVRGRNPTAMNFKSKKTCEKHHHWRGGKSSGCSTNSNNHRVH